MLRVCGRMLPRSDPRREILSTRGSLGMLDRPWRMSRSSTEIVYSGCGCGCGCGDSVVFGGSRRRHLTWITTPVVRLSYQASITQEQPRSALAPGSLYPIARPWLSAQRMPIPRLFSSPDTTAPQEPANHKSEHHAEPCLRVESP